MGETPAAVGEKVAYTLASFEYCICGGRRAVNDGCEMFREKNTKRVRNGVDLVGKSVRHGFHAGIQAFIYKVTRKHFPETGLLMEKVPCFPSRMSGTKHSEVNFLLKFT